MGSFIRHTPSELEQMTKVELIALVNKLEEYVTRDSTNSSKAPSSDGTDSRKKRDEQKNKNTSLRGKSERKVGGQKGHAAANLQAVANPHYQHTLELEQCPECKQIMREENLTGEIISRQILDLPEQITLIRTQYDAPIYQCRCGCKTHAVFPHGVDAPVQYGPRLYSWLFHMREQMLLPYERITVFFKDLMGINLSPATIQRAQRSAYEKLEPFEEALISKLVKQPS